MTPAGQRTFVVTGASDGIGLACSEQLARLEPPPRLVLVGRDPGRTAAAVARVRRTSPAARVDSLLTDLGDQAACRRLAADLLAACPRIDVLVNNAGAVFARRHTTVDGIEATFAVDHLGGFLLTELLRERLIESAPARVVFTSSDGHVNGDLDFEDLGLDRGYSIMRAYNRAKLANVLTARELARQLDGTGVTVNALHPGMIASDIWAGAPWFARPVLAVLKRWRMESVEVGGSRVAYLAASPEVEGRTGGYYRRNELRDPSPLARDDSTAARLYDVSRRLVSL